MQNKPQVGDTVYIDGWIDHYDRHFVYPEICCRIVGGGDVLVILKPINDVVDECGCELRELYMVRDDGMLMVSPRNLTQMRNDPTVWWISGRDMS